MTILEMLSIGLPAALCIIAGVILLGIEIFMPGFGVPGISGVVLIIVGYVIGKPTLLGGLLILLLIVVVLGTLLAIALRSATKGRLSHSPLVLQQKMDGDEGFTAAKDMEYFIGREGVAITALRPAGTADFDGVKLDVVSESEFIDKDSPLKIISVEGRRIVVRRMDASAQPASGEDAPIQA